MANNYWAEAHPDKVGNVDFIDGILAGVKAFAVWSDGQQLVGVMRTPLADVEHEIRFVMKDPRGSGQ